MLLRMSKRIALLAMRQYTRLRDIVDLGCRAQ
jgi:hypothetical protein